MKKSKERLTGNELASTSFRNDARETVEFIRWNFALKNLPELKGLLNASYSFQDWWTIGSWIRGENLTRAATRPWEKSEKFLAVTLVHLNKFVWPTSFTLFGNGCSHDQSTDKSFNKDNRIKSIVTTNKKEPQNGLRRARKCKVGKRGRDEKWMIMSQLLS